jgi:murein L,D-transpeptidase YcbB/YkuD
VKRTVLFGALVALLMSCGGVTSSWADEFQWTGERTAALLKVLRAAADHGLDPQWYGADTLEQVDASSNPQPLTDALVAYASDVSTGRVNANSVDRDIDIQQRRTVRTDLLKAAANAPDFAQWLAALPPKGDYPALQKILADLRQKRATAPYTPLPAGSALKPLATDARVPVLRKRLGELGFAVPPPTTTEDVYDEALATLVKSYQQTKGLTVDGVIGANTARSLNTSIDELITQVIANLERRRWLPEQLGSRYVFVNAGDYSVVFVDGGTKVFESLVIVGTPGHPTPEIQSVINGFQTNPYWTVPTSISGEEYLPLLRRDPNALAASGFKIFSSWSDNDSEIDPSTVDWSGVSSRAFPYRVRQDPGPGNALGYIFFGFANKYGIYMHDTASRGLFTEGSRNFSHGCIRLQNPLDFAEKAFNGRAGFDKTKVQQVIAAGRQASYSFPEPVTLYVTYRTVGVASDGSAVFRDDVYGRDKRVVAAMARPRS